jgi:hypothetical protein
MSKANPTTGSNLVAFDTTRLDAIAKALNEGVNAAMKNADDLNDLKDETTRERDAGEGQRERIMRSVADLADAEDWSKAEIDEAIARLKAQRNENKLPTTVNTFVSEMGIAMREGVRSDIHHIMSACDDAWAAETAMLEHAKGAKAADKPETPFRKAFKRRYHFLTSIMRQASEGEAHYVSQGALLAYAAECDPDNNAKKLAKRIETATEALAAVNELLLDVEDLDKALDTLRRIEVDEVARGRRRKLGLPEPVATTPQPKAAKPGKNITVVNPTATAPITPAPVAFDDGLDTLDELVAGLGETRA